MTTKIDDTTKLHSNGDVSYWSVYEQMWTRDPAYAVPDRELAAMPVEVRKAVTDHAKLHPMGDEADEADE